MLDKFDLTSHIKLFGWVTISISIITWGIDVAEMISACSYCRTERSTIGLLGLIMVLPHYRYVSIFLALVFGFMGCNVASAQVFMHIKYMSFSILMTGMAVSALCIIIGQVLLVFDRAKRVESNRVSS